MKSLELPAGLSDDQQNTWLLARILFPDSSHVADAYYLRERALRDSMRTLPEDIVTFTCTGGVMLALIEPPDGSWSAAYRNRWKAGRTAGLMLHLHYLHRKVDPALATREKLYKGLQYMSLELGLGREHAFADKKSCDAAWNLMSSVAHFWAANEIVDSVIPGSFGPDLGSGMSPWLRISGGFLAYGLEATDGNTTRPQPMLRENMALGIPKNEPAFDLDRLDLPLNPSYLEFIRRIRSKKGGHIR